MTLDDMRFSDKGELVVTFTTKLGGIIVVKENEHGITIECPDISVGETLIAIVASGTPAPRLVSKFKGGYTIKCTPQGTEGTKQAQKNTGGR